MSLGLFAPEQSVNTAAMVLRQAADTFAAEFLREAAATVLDELDHVRRIAGIGIAMRAAQRSYFRTRSQKDLARAKELEAQFDRLVKE